MPFRIKACRIPLCALAVLWLGVVAWPARGETRRLTVLATTDVHGHVWPYDYLQGKEAERGLAKVSTYVKLARASNPNMLLLDCGDTFQGTPLAYLYAGRRAADPNPVVAAMNAMKYDAMAVGNHEFNFGLYALWRMKAQAHFPILGANIISTYHHSLRDFRPYIVREVGGVRVGILGLVTPAIPRWEPPDHRAGYEFRDLVETARKYIPELQRKADVIIAIVHSGLGRDPETDEPGQALYSEEDQVWEIAEQVSGIDVIFFGHSHRELEGKTVNGALLVQPKNWAQSVAEVELVLERKGTGWRLSDKQSRLVPMGEDIPADPEILDLTREAHQRTERWLNTVVAQLGDELDGRTGRVRDHPLVELIHCAQLWATGADVSLAALFSTSTHWESGPVTIRDVYNLYFYENKLFTVRITGAQLKQALEYSARSFKSYPWEGSPFADMPGYNYDMAQGVSYRIDLKKPPGKRILQLTFQGEPLAPDRTLRLALNSYRWSGGGAYEMLRHAEILDKSEREVRELIVDYLRQKKAVPTEVDHNWKIIPEEAREALLDFLRPPESVPTSAHSPCC